MASVPLSRRYKVSLIVLLALTSIVALLFFRILQIFLLPLFSALILVIIFQPVYHWVLTRCGNRRALAAGLTTAAVFGGVLVPFFVLASLAVAEGMAIFGQTGWGQVVGRLARLRAGIDLEMPYEALMRRADRLFLDTRTAIENGQVFSQAAAAQLDQTLQRLEDQLTAEDQRRAGTWLAAARQLLAQQPIDDPWAREEAFWEAWRNYQQFRAELLGGPARQWLIELLNPDAPQRRQWREAVGQFVQAYLVPLGGAAVVFLLKLAVGLVIAVIAVFFFFLDGPKMLVGIGRLVPLAEAHQRELIHEFATASRAIVLAIIVSALVQGVLAGIGFWLAGFQAVFLLSGLTILCAVIPFIGATTVWLPAVIWLYFVEERTGAAVALLAYGAIVVSQIDNLIKPWILHGHSHLHPLLGLLSVLGGVQALGAIGVLLGPIVVVCLQTALRIVHRELLAGSGGGEARPAQATAGT